MRIVAGRLKRRALAAPSGISVRPTSERARAALFNTIEHGGWGVGLQGARVLDAFAGTGALGLESLSRGAKHATFVENDRAALVALRRNIKSLGVVAEATVLEENATRVRRASEPVDIAFLDPPYGSLLAEPALVQLDEAGWLKPETLIVIELAAKQDFDAPDGFQLKEERRYGAAKLVFLGLEAST